MAAILASRGWSLAGLNIQMMDISTSALGLATVKNSRTMKADPESEIFVNDKNPLSTPV
jgi:hypothetical protein